MIYERKFESKDGKQVTFGLDNNQFIIERIDSKGVRIRDKFSSKAAQQISAEILEMLQKDSNSKKQQHQRAPTFDSFSDSQKLRLASEIMKSVDGNNAQKIIQSNPRIQKNMSHIILNQNKDMPKNQKNVEKSFKDVVRFIYSQFGTNYFTNSQFEEKYNKNSIEIILGRFCKEYFTEIT